MAGLKTTLETLKCVIQQGCKETSLHSKGQVSHVRILCALPTLLKHVLSLVCSQVFLKQHGGNPWP